MSSPVKLCSSSTMVLLLAASAGWATEPVSFSNDVMPIFTRYGCNAGVCHAKAGGGQNGFQLSLLGFEPAEDYEHLVLEARGRRFFPADPDRSLLLRKVSGETPHGGGLRLPKDSPSYSVLRRWIAQGMPRSAPDEPTLRKITVQPPTATVAPNGELSLTATAHYSDGQTRDVTDLALFECNDDGMGEVDPSGRLHVRNVPGQIAVMVRYQSQVSVFNGLVPLGEPLADEQLPAANNFIDQHVFGKLQRIGVPPSPVCDDATFLRRVSLDITGRIPTAEQAREFLNDDDPNKREALVESLLRSPSYADYFASKWTTVLKNRRDDASDITSNFAFHAWIRDSLLANKPYDTLVRELLAATGTVIANPPVAWYKRVKDPKQQIEDVAQLFLGVRMQCAQCHHHPFERWSQDDYYGLTAFFSRVGRKPTDTRGEDLIYHQRGTAGSTHAKTGATVAPRALGDDVGEIPPDEDPRLRLADWMARQDNPYFAKALVNRYWKHFFRRGLIEPEDDIRDTNPPTNPELLAALEKHFVESGFDLKELVRVIVNSNAYQLSSIPNERNVIDRQNYSRYYPKRMQAEAMLDAIDQFTGATTTFPNLPAGTRAVALPDNSYNKNSPFLKVFGRPESTSVCECERVQTGSLAQSLHLINDASIKAKVNVAGGLADRLSKSDAPDEEKITELYTAAFGRPPLDSEMEIALEYLHQSRTDADGKAVPAATAVREHFQDLVWALINTKEFLYHH